MVDVALRGVGATIPASRRLRSVFFKQTEYIHSTFDVERSMFDVHQFLFRSDWTLRLPTSGLNPEPLNLEPLIAEPYLLYKQ